MAPAPSFEIFAAAPPGLEPLLAQELRALSFQSVQEQPGGVALQGGWAEVWRANLMSRLASRVLVRIASFPVFHLAQLDKRARKVPWAEILPRGQPVRLDVSTRKSKIYHAGAAAERIARAITEAVAAPVVRASEDETALAVKARIDDNRCTISLDSSGAPLHRRGFKTAIGKAPMRETLAAGFLQASAYSGAEPVIDPMCGSGTFVLEAAEIAAGLAPGRGRGFAFEQFASFDAAAWETLRATAATPVSDPTPLAQGYDRDSGVIGMATQNAARAGLDGRCSFACQPISALTRPDGPPGLVICNPPYGGRIGNKKLLYALYASFGAAMLAGFRGWRVAIVTSEAGLARATQLPFDPPGPPIPHGGLKVRLWQCGPL